MKSNRDESLVQFLKQNQPTPPAAHPDAEEALFALIDAETMPTESPSTKLKLKHKKVIWLIPTAIAAGLTIMWGRYQADVLSPKLAEQDPSSVFTANQTDPTADDNLEAYLESAWGDPFTEAALDSELSDGDFGYAEVLYSP